MEIEIVYDAQINWSMLQAGIPFVRKLILINKTNKIIEDYDLGLRIPSCVQIGPIRTGRLEPGKPWVARDLPCSIDYTGLLYPYSRSTQLTVSTGGEALHLPVQILAPDEWVHCIGPERNTVKALRVYSNIPATISIHPTSEDILWDCDPPSANAVAALVFPEDPVVQEIKRRAIPYPGNVNKETIRITRYIYDFFRQEYGKSARHDIEKLSIKENSQRIRFPQEIFKGNVYSATCIDYVLLFSAVLEACGVDTVLILVGSGATAHALLGAWRRGSRQEWTALYDETIFRRYLPHMQVFDVVNFIYKQRWSGACKGADDLLNGEAQFLYAVDMASARRKYSVEPLPLVGVLENLRSEAFPADLADSVLFLARSTSAGGLTKSDEWYSVADILRKWLSLSSSQDFERFVATPLVLGFQFPLDLVQTLYAISKHPEIDKFQERRVVLRRIEDLKRSMDDLETDFVQGRAPRTTIVLDFSSYASAPFDIIREDLWGKVDAFWAKIRQWRRYELVIGVPAWLLSDRYPLGSQYAVFTPAPLFAERYADWIPECEKLIKGGSRLGPTLRTLVSINSSTLPAAVAEFISEHPSEEWEPARDPHVLRRLAALAASLSDQRFYEIAYRLEGALLLAVDNSRDNAVIDCDVFGPDSVQSQDVVDYLNDVRMVPAFVRRGLLIGEPGSGKSSSQKQIEDFWIIPRTESLRRTPIRWVPIRLSANGANDPKPTVCLRNSLRDQDYIDFQGEIISLNCHRLVAEFEFEQLPRLFGSPLYFLIDGFDDRVGERGRYFLQRCEAFNFFRHCGFLMSSQIGKGTADRLVREVRIRQLSWSAVRQKIGQFANLQLRDLIVELDELVAIPIANMLRNPQLLNWICHLDNPRIFLKQLDLERLLEAQVAQLRLRDTTRSWLEIRAFEARQYGLSVPKDDRNRAEVVEAQRCGLLRQTTDDYTEFRSQIILDYFAALFLFRRIESGEDLKAVLESTKMRELDSWGTCLAILTPLLSPPRLHELMKVLCVRNLTLAARCMRACPPDRRVPIDLGPFVQNLRATTSSLERRVAIANALGPLDPRICVNHPEESLAVIDESDGTTGTHLGRYPVTNLEYNEFIKAGGYQSSEFWCRGGRSWLNERKVISPDGWPELLLERANWPVVGISFYEAAAYCRWLSSFSLHYWFRLPTAFEWDRAALGPGVGEETFLSRWLFRSRVALLRSALQRTKGTFTSEGPLIRNEKWDEFAQPVRRTLAPYLATIQSNYARPIGLSVPRGEFFDLFGGTWQWCDTGPNGERLLSETNSRDVTAIVKGGNNWDNSDPVRILLGGFFDVGTRFNRLGFRLAAEPRVGNREKTDATLDF